MKTARTLATLIMLLALSQDIGVWGQEPQAPSEESQKPAVVAFVNVNVVPMDRERILPGQTVIVRADRISEVGPADMTDIPEGALRIDGRDKYLMPGLVDMHVHQRTELRDFQLTLFIANGVTTIRNMWGSEHDLKRREDIRIGSDTPNPYVVPAFSLHQELQNLVEAVMSSGRIYVRSASVLYVSKANVLKDRLLVRRLMQLGLQAYIVGEAGTPDMEKGDLLIVTSPPTGVSWTSTTSYDITSDSAYAAILITPQNRVCMYYRSEAGGNTDSIETDQNAIALPHWIKLIRQGKMFKAQHSEDGKKWKDLKGSSAGIEIEMDEVAHVGLAVCSEAGSAIAAEAKISRVLFGGDWSSSGRFTWSEDIGYKAWGKTEEKRTILPDE